MYIILAVSKNSTFSENIRSAFQHEQVTVDTLKDYNEFVDYLPQNIPALIITDCSTNSIKNFRLMSAYLSARYHCGFAFTGTPKQLHPFHNHLQQIGCTALYIEKSEINSTRKLIDYFHLYKTTENSISSDDLFSEKNTKDFEALLLDKSASSFTFKKYQSIFPLFQFFSCIVQLDSPYKADKYIFKLWSITKNFLIMKYSDKKALILFWTYIDQFQNLISLRETLIHRCQTKQYRDVWIGCIHTGLYGAYKSFLEAKETYYIDYLYHPAISFDEISSSVKSASKPIRLVEIERQIRSTLEYRNGDGILKLTHDWFDECQKMNYTLENIQMDLLNLYSSIKYVIFDMYTLHATRIKNGWEVYELFHIHSVDELKEWFFDWLNYTLNNIQVKKGQGFQIEDVLEFINHHLLEKITLESTAGFFGYNTSYFSTMFKKETQETFISYVSRHKMQKAFELLQNGRKVAEVAALLGYSDLKYFRTLFKQQFHISPSSVHRLDSKQENNTR